MASKDQTFIATIDHVERRNSSRNGNPAWTVYFKDHEAANTMADTSWSYGADNPEWQGARVEVTTTPGGRIRWCKHAPEQGWPAPSYGPSL